MDQYFLEIEDRSGQSSVVPLDRFPFTIGRGTENNLVLPEPSVSRDHACIRRMPEGLLVVDKNSRNGVFVNSEKVFNIRLLHPGDTVRIGSAKLTLTMAGGPQIPIESQGSETIHYLPFRETWDPVGELAGRMPREAARRAPGEEPRAPNWPLLLRKLFWEAPLPDMHEHVLDIIEDTVPFDRCFIILFGEGASGENRILAQRLHGNVDSDVIISRNILQRVAQNREAVVVTAEDTPSDAMQSVIRSGARSAICIPLTVGGRVIGGIYLDRTSPTWAYAQGDVETMGPVAGVVALKIENLRLLHEHLASQILARDLELAKAVQENLLPQEPVSLPGYSVEGHASPCYQVGGDYFDFFPGGDEHLTMVIGDVSGKGLPSAMYMGCIRTALHAHVEDGLEIDALMSKLERHTRSTFRSDHFVTLFLGRLEAESGLLTYCNAGHLPPVGLTRTGALFELQGNDPALNITPWHQFRRHEFRLTPGDLLLLYTDGLTEAENAAGERYGSERLLSCLARHRARSLAHIRREILSDLESFVGGQGPSDDRTLILVRREEV